MTPLTQILIATLAFGLSATLATRLGLGFGKQGTPQQVSSWFEKMQLETRAARGYINRLLLRMGWAWVLLCAPLLAYERDAGLVFKRYAVALLGCLLLGSILSAMTYNQVKNFKSIRIDNEEVQRRAADSLMDKIREGGYEAEELERAYLEEKQDAYVKAQEAALAKARSPLLRSNDKIFMFVFSATLLIPLLYVLAVLASGFSLAGYIALIAVLAVLILFVYAISSSL
jgi:hypothetical protein